LLGTSVFNFGTLILTTSIDGTLALLATNASRQVFFRRIEMLFCQFDCFASD